VPPLVKISRSAVRGASSGVEDLRNPLSGVFQGTPGLLPGTVLDWLGLA